MKQNLHVKHALFVFLLSLFGSTESVMTRWVRKGEEVAGDFGILLRGRWRNLRALPREPLRAVVGDARRRETAPAKALE